MPFKYCTHVKEDGLLCRSAALRGRDFCYFHLRTRAHRLAIARSQAQGTPWSLELPPLENMQSVQVGLMRVMDALAAGCLDARRAALLLYGLQQAATNLKSQAAWLVPARFEVKPDSDHRVDHYPSLEQEFGLPKNVDLDASPETLFPPPLPVLPEMIGFADPKKRGPSRAESPQPAEAKQRSRASG